MLQMKKILSLILVVCGLTLSAQTTQTILSPDQKLKLKVDLGGEIIRYSVFCENGEFLKPSSIGMELGNGTLLGREPIRSLRKGGRRSVDRMVASPLYRKDSIRDQYNELYLQYKAGYSVVFRVYNNTGAKYRDYQVQINVKSPSQSSKMTWKQMPEGTVMPVTPTTGWSFTYNAAGDGIVASFDNGAEVIEEVLHLVREYLHSNPAQGDG